MFVSLAFIFVHGIDYVNWPRLQPLTDIIYYDGPGYRAHRHGMGLGLPALEKLVGKRVVLASNSPRRREILKTFVRLVT